MRRKSRSKRDHSYPELATNKGERAELESAIPIFALAIASLCHWQRFGEGEGLWLRIRSENSSSALRTSCSNRASFRIRYPSPVSRWQKPVRQQHINWCMINFCSTETPGRTLRLFARRGLSLKFAS